MSYINNIRTFVRVFELGSMSAAGRDLRVSAAVSSNRIMELEKHLGVRLFVRTTRKLTPTRHGELFYKGAIKILDTIEEVEASIAEITANPKGTLFISAPLGIGKKLIAPLVPEFQSRYPQVLVRLRLSDRNVDVMEEGLDAAFILGRLGNSELRLRPVCDLERVLVASPAYVKKHGAPETADDLQDGTHRCLLLRFPGVSEFHWTLRIDGQARQVKLESALESDDGDVLTAWALAGHGIVNKPVFEIEEYLENGKLIPVARNIPPTALPFTCLYPHKRLQDPKARLFIEFMVEACRKKLT